MRDVEEYKAIMITQEQSCKDVHKPDFFRDSTSSPSEIKVVKNHKSTQHLRR